MKWRKSLFLEELSEFKRVAYSFKLQLSNLRDTYNNAPLSLLTNDTWEELNNTDSWDIKYPSDLTTLCKIYNRDPSFILIQLKKDSELNCPIILKFKNEYHLIAGNTRLMCCKLLKVQPEVVIVEL